MTAGFGLNVPVPRDATRVGEWLPGNDGRLVQVFDGTSRTAAGCSVDIVGQQCADGMVAHRWLTVAPLDDLSESAGFDAAAARRHAPSLHNIAEIESITDPELAAEGFVFADALQAAADELDLWSRP
ncbi:hypothetical protein [Mycobacterium sp. 852002-40037_SCH5390672]|uniref:hypothetical protein n=1 Tax=Mycobacterium sp. 852002-40037_SCH5390672 TaxID=1834089 RepID=UPI000805CA8E|nr:hypothetical protein [Mycobacterium sp. 852002-40037_SCH5390672]OBB95936.1 hypothetical protein A5782_05695 [Mycobacterium sp. 852002-40037_SCH5390672]